MVSGYFCNLESNLQWYFSDVLPGGTFRVRSHGRGQRPAEKGRERQEKGNEPWYCTWYPDLVSSALSTIIHSHYILTPHHHPTYYKSSQKTPPGKWAAMSGHGEGKWYSLNYEDNISLNFWNDIHRASGIIDKHDKTLSLNKLFWAKKSLGNIAAGSSSFSFNSFCLFW